MMNTKKLIILAAILFAVSARSIIQAQTNAPPAAPIVYTLQMNYSADDWWAIGKVYDRHKQNDTNLAAMNLSLTNYVIGLFENFKTNVTNTESAAGRKKLQPAYESPTNSPAIRAAVLKSLGIDPNSVPPSDLK